MKYIFIPFFIAIAFVAQGQSTKKKTQKEAASSSFPTSFIGKWKGKMQWCPNNGKPCRDVAVELEILPIKDSTNQYTWKITYGDKQNDVRPYILKKIDTVANHWVVDELNGIVLDSYVLGNKFMGAFAVQGALVLDNYWIENGDLHFEFFSYKTTPTGTTGKDTEESPKVDIYKIGSYQKGVLKKVG